MLIVLAYQTIYKRDFIKGSEKDGT